MNLFGSASQGQPSALSQILAMIPKTGQASMQSAPQQPAMGSPAQAPAVPAAQGGGNPLSGGVGGNLINQASNLQMLPWLDTGQNIASMTGAMGQAAGGAGGSALSMLASMFL